MARRRTRSRRTYGSHVVQVVTVVDQRVFEEKIQTRAEVRKGLIIRQKPRLLIDRA